MDFRLKTPRDRAEGVDAVEEIWGLMNRINKRDTRMAYKVYQECADGDRCAHPGSVYANLKAAVSAALMSLGVEVEEVDAALEYLADGCSARDVIDVFGI